MFTFVSLLCWRMCMILHEINFETMNLWQLFINTLGTQRNMIFTPVIKKQKWDKLVDIYKTFED